MSGFSSDWLALRAPFDRRARSAALADAFLAAVPAGGLIVDLGAGTGANAAALRARDRASHRWRLVDDDPALLARADGGSGIERREADLAAALESALDGAAGVTASALLDLVSREWLERLAAALAARRLPALFALSYDGRMRWAPFHPGDARILLDFHLDMRRDKGFGPALGPAAPVAAVDSLVRRGARVIRAPSDWAIGPADDAMLAAMVDGVAAPASAIAPGDSGRVAAWAALRHAQLRAGALALDVGHEDLYARFG